MTDTCPRSGLRDVMEFKVGMGVFGGSLYGGTGSKVEGSNASPSMNDTGNVSGVDLKSSCPRSQNAVVSLNHLGNLYGHTEARTLLDIRRKDSFCWESVRYDLSCVIAN